jgi:hypothetical protein
MQWFLRVAFILVFSVCTFAQRSGWMGNPPLVGPDFPAVGGALPIVNPFSSGVPFAQRLGATVSGFPGYNGAPSGGFRGGHRRGNGFYPIMYPVFGSAYEPPDQSPSLAVLAPPPQQAPQPIIINQYFGPESKPSVEDVESSSVQSYAAPSSPRPAPAEDQALFFVALHDSSVYTAVAYWVEDGTLNYVTPQGRHNQVSLALVDRETTGKLNQGSKYELHLPAK